MATSSLNLACSALLYRFSCGGEGECGERKGEGQGRGRNMADSVEEVIAYMFMRGILSKLD